MLRADSGNPPISPIARLSHIARACPRKRLRPTSLYTSMSTGYASDVVPQRNNFGVTGPGPFLGQKKTTMEEMSMVSCLSSLRIVVLTGAALCALALPAAADPSTRVALVPGGPHPYFAAWEQAGHDAKKDFNLGAADYKVPQKWELSEQNHLLESLLTQGYNAFLIFPGDPVGSNSTVAELVDTAPRSSPRPAASRIRRRRSSASARTPATPPISAPRN